MCTICNFDHPSNPKISRWCHSVFSRWHYFEYILENDRGHLITETHDVVPWLVYAGMKIFQLTPADMTPEREASVVDFICPLVFNFLPNQIRMTSCGRISRIRLRGELSALDIYDAMDVLKIHLTNLSR